MALISASKYVVDNKYVATVSTSFGGSWAKTCSVCEYNNGTFNTASAGPSATVSVPLTDVTMTGNAGANTFTFVPHRPCYILNMESGSLIKDVTDSDVDVSFSASIGSITLILFK